tara:strand:- start:160 stop:636 length:477 start_codon:yes stop_codon:yes gene_type:complete
MVDIRQENNHTQGAASTTPETITISMILEDLDNGVDRTGIKAKYNLEAWEVKQMFDHPKLKGKKAKRVKKLSFSFIDDTSSDKLPGQIDLEDAIETENQSMKDVMIDEINGRKTMDAQDQVQSMGESKTEAEVVITETEKTLNNLETRADDWSNSTQF